MLVRLLALNDMGISIDCAGDISMLCCIEGVKDYMSIRSSGLWCDVCNKPILMPLKDKDGNRYHPFKVNISPTPMDACHDCKPLLDPIEYDKLPEGPLKNLMDRVEALDKGRGENDFIQGRDPGDEQPDNTDSNS